MKTKNIIHIALIFCITLVYYSANCQNFLPTPSTNINPHQKEFITYNLKSDTIWLYRTYKIYSWQGNEYVQTETWTYYEYLDENAPTKPSAKYHINSESGDTILMIKYEYDTLQRFLSQTNFENDIINNTYEETDRWIYAYDKFGNDTLVLWQTWNSSTFNWENKMQIIRAFNNKNYFLLEKVREWEPIGNYWVTAGGYQYDYFYNEAGCPDSLIWDEWNYDKKGWDNYIKQYWKYNENDVPLQYTYKLWKPNLSAYEYYERFISLDFHNWPGCNCLDHTYKPLFDSLHHQFWINGWTDLIQYSAIYDDLGGYEFLILEPFNNEWQNSERRQVRFNDKGLNIFKNKEIWINGKWKLERADTSIFIYDGDKKLVHILNEADTAHNNDWVHFSKFVYGDYTWYVGVDDYFDNDGSQINKITVIPNPTAGNISVEIKDKSEAIAKLELIDISGKVLLQERSYNPGSNRVEIENTGFEKGIYIIKVLTKENKVYFTKLIVN